MSFMKNIAVCWRCANLFRAAKFEKLGISCYQYPYILNVCGNPGISQDSLAEIIFIHKSNVARQLASLEEKGFIIRKPAPDDKRSLLVFPTEKAEAALPVIKDALAEWNALLLDDFDESEKELLNKLTEKLSEKSKAIVGSLEVGNK